MSWKYPEDPPLIYPKEIHMDRIGETHFFWHEFNCFNRLTNGDGKPIPFNGIPSGGIVAVYPLDWRISHGLPLAKACEAVRSIRNEPIIPNSVYRPLEYNLACGSTPGSWHIKGCAADLPCPANTDYNAWFEEVRRRILSKFGDYVLIGGLGRYSTGRFIHIDIRPRTSTGRIAEWIG